MNRKRRLNAQLLSRFGLLVGLFILFATLESSFATWANIFAVFEGFAFAGLMAVGVGITIFAGEMDLSIASVAALSGVISVLLANKIPAVLAVLVAVVFCAAFGALQGWAIGLLGINSIVLTLGSMIAIRGLVYIIAREQTAILDNLDIADMVKYKLFIFTPFSLITIAVLVLLGLFMRYVRWGRNIYALGGGRNEALAAGVPLLRSMVLIFAFSAGLSGLCGALVSLKSGSAMPRGLEDLLLPAVTAVLVGGASLTGGKGTIQGTFIGVIILRFISSYINFKGMPYFVESLATGIVLVVVIAIELLTETPEARERWRHWAQLRRERMAPASTSAWGDKKSST